MYALLVKADLVVADITTLNPNALYELGIRHAARPKSTIILKDKDGSIPFDLNHNRFLIYTHLGDDIGASEAKKCQELLENLVKSIEKQELPDSPMFEYLSDMVPHDLSEDDYRHVISYLSEKENNIFAASEKAKMFMSNKKFIEAAACWKKASKIAPEDHYFIQQQTLCTYKSEQPSKSASLLAALSIISPIYDSSETNDPETLGLVGAIYKRLYETNNDVEVLNRAIEAYKRGYTVSSNYYTGENFASCLDLLAKKTDNSDELAYCRYEAKSTRKKIVESLLKIIDDEAYSEPKWMYATLANLSST